MRLKNADVTVQVLCHEDTCFANRKDSMRSI